MERVQILFRRGPAARALERLGHFYDKAGGRTKSVRAKEERFVRSGWTVNN